MAFSFWLSLQLCVSSLLLCHISCFLAIPASKLPNTTVSFHTTFNKNGNSSDELALLSFKSLITHDPYKALASWGNHSLPFCHWNGVKCNKNRYRHKVIALDLHSFGLVGSISPSVGNLSFLQRLHLSENQLSGPIPKELGLLSNLRHLNLSFNQLEGMIPHAISQCFLLQTIGLMNNSFRGEIPSNLSRCSNLETIDFRNNFFSGAIPVSLGALNHLKQLLLSNNLLEAKEESDWAFLDALANCTNIRAIDLSINKLGGAFPSSIGNLSTGLRILSIYTNQISGSIPPSICKLINLRIVQLGDNLLEGTLPQEIGNLRKLEFLNLFHNQMFGAIPNSLGNLSSLKIFSLYGNQFGGGIPTVIQNLSSLNTLTLSKNHFVGSLPQFLGSLSSLGELYLAFNNLSGSIPPTLGNLHSLTQIALGFNNLEGVIPDSIWNLSSLQYLQLQQNNLFGIIPPEIGQTLPNLLYLLLYQNQLHGPIPTSLANCSSLKHIDLSVNAFTGKVPASLGALKNLSGLVLDDNKLEARDSTDWAFLESLTNCTNLKYLFLGANEFSGILPNSIANLSTNLNFLSLMNNKIGGTIPIEIKNLIGLSWLELAEMHLTGIIPLTMGCLPSLQILDLRFNEFYGEIPYTLGNLTNLNKLYFQHNNLSGHIPPPLGLCKQLELLNIENNMLIGVIPYEITSLFSLTIGLFLSNNFLNGSLPSNVGSLINLDNFDVSNNKLSGQIPDSLGQCMQLRYLSMKNNFLEGTIPLSLKALRGLEEIDLSHNNLIGEIPKYLENFSFQYLNLSFNNFEGEVPKNGIFANASAFSVFGNKQLCGGILELNLPSCFNKPMRNGRLRLVLSVTVATIVVFIVILIILCIVFRNKLCKVSPSILRLTKKQHISISYAELFKATNGFSSENLIGAGSFGSVYKGNMDNIDNNIVAVKVFNLQQYGASRSFEAECKALRSARHRNLVKVLTACISIDYAGNDFKALVFELMPNGSLDKWLHPQLNDGNTTITYLNFVQRLNIVVDVACALDYLHNQGSMQIIHCDLKPSNVLLDEDMIAHVGDFGLANLLTKVTIESSQRSIESLSLRGTIGYVPPEYGMANQVSTKGDVYSFGILLLEIFTGRRPTDGIFIESHSLHHFVQMALPLQVMNILDLKMFSQLGDEEVDNKIQQMNKLSKYELECIVSTLNVGLLCSKESPLERIQIEQAYKELHAIKDEFQKVEQARHSLSIELPKLCK